MPTVNETTIGELLAMHCERMLIDKSVSRAATRQPGVTFWNVVDRCAEAAADSKNTTEVRFERRPSDEAVAMLAAQRINLSAVRPHFQGGYYAIASFGSMFARAAPRTGGSFAHPYAL
jgi:hypothetical protein